MRWNKIKAKRVLDTLATTGGNISEMCKVEGISRKTFHAWVNRYKWFRDEALDIRETVKDNIESALYKNALEGNVIAQIFMAKTICKDRGYVENEPLRIDQYPTIEIIDDYVEPEERDEIPLAIEED